MATQNDEWGSSSSAADDVSFDTSGYTAGDLGGGNLVNKEGWYHFEVTDVVEDLEVVNKQGGQKSPSFRFDCTVLCNVNGQSPAGAVLFHRCYVGAKGGGSAAEGAVKSFLRFLRGLGSVEESKELKNEAGEPIMVDEITKQPKITAQAFLRCKGRQFIARVKKEESEGKYDDKFTIPYGNTYSPLDPDVADILKDADALRLAGYDPAKCGKVTGQPLSGAKPAGHGNGAAKGAAAKPQNVTTAGPDLDDL